MHRTPTRQGFTLIEMAIVLVVVGLLAGLTLPLVGDLIKREKRSATNSTLEKARNEIIGFAIKNRRLPSAIDGSDSDFGSLGKDAYGDSLVYKVDSALSASGNDLCDTDPADDLTLRVTDTSGDTDYGRLGFILLSKGRDMNQQYGESGNTIHVWAPGSYSGSGEFDDQYAFASLNYLRSQICSPSDTAGETGGPEGSDIAFDGDMSDFSGGDNASSPAASSSSFITVNADNTLDLGDGTTDGYGCSWYQGSNANCVNGRCQWHNGIRAYFEFKTLYAEGTTNQSQTYGDGFTFVMASTSARAGNDATKCGAGGEDMGYADGSSPIAPPKIGIEYDMYPNSGKNDTTNGANHLAVIYWANSSSNDNEHYIQVRDPRPDSPNRNPDSSNSDSGFLHKGNSMVNWMEDGSTYAARVEVAVTGGYEDNFAVKAWVSRCDGACNSTLSNLTATYTATAPDVTGALDLSSSDADQQFDTFQMGWTTGTGSKVQSVTISNFGIKFLN